MGTALFCTMKSPGDLWHNAAAALRATELYAPKRLRW